MNKDCEEFSVELLSTQTPKRKDCMQSYPKTLQIKCVAKSQRFFVKRKYYIYSVSLNALKKPYF
jgi:hypothetical protein